jgi:hypothetical protein
MNGGTNFRIIVSPDKLFFTNELFTFTCRFSYNNKCGVKITNTYEYLHKSFYNKLLYKKLLNIKTKKEI